MALFVDAGATLDTVCRYHLPVRVTPPSPMPQRSSPAVSIFILVLNLLGWASVPLFLRHFADFIDGWTSNGWRYGFSALVWLPVLLIAAMSKRLPRGLWTAALVPSLINAAGQTCFTLAHYLIDPGLLTFGLRTQLLFVAIGAWMLFPRERAIIRRFDYLLGAVLLIAGSVLVLALAQPEKPMHSLSDAAASLIAPHAEPPGRGSPAAHTFGVILAVGSGLLFACYGLSVRKFMDGVNPVLAFAAICQYTAIILVIVMIARGAHSGGTALQLPAAQMAMLLLSALIGIAIGHVFYYISIARLGVAVTAGVLQLQPFIVALFSLTLFGERLNRGQWLGGCLAVVGAMTMLAVQWRMSRTAPPHKARLIEEPVAIAEGESGA